MNYGKLIDGNVQVAQSVELQNGGRIYNPTADQWLDNGYLPIIEGERQPEVDGYYQIGQPKIVDNQIIVEYLYILNPAQNDNV